MSMRPSAPEQLSANAQKATRPGCLARLLRFAAGIFVAAILGWISSLFVAALVPMLVSALGAASARDGKGFLSLVLAAVPFAISFVLSLIGGLVINRRPRFAA